MPSANKPCIVSFRAPQRASETADKVLFFKDFARPGRAPSGASQGRLILLFQGALFHVEQGRRIRKQAAVRGE